MSTDAAVAASAADPNAGLTKTQLKNKLRREREKKAKAEGASQESKSSSEAAQLAAGFQKLAIHSFFEGHMKLAHHKNKGRHVVATKNMEAGETVFTSAPYAAVVTDTMVDQICHRCFQVPGGAKPMLYQCGGCKHARFCSTNCMNAFKHIHSLECKSLARLEEIGLDGETAAVRLVIRMMYLQRQEKTLEEFKQIYDKMPPSQIPKEKRAAFSVAKLFTPKAGLSFDDCANLESHEQDFASEQKVDIAMILSRVEDIVDKDACLPVSLATKLFLQISVNAHHIVDRTKRRLGLALYPSASYMNHSCRPNCIYFFNPNGQIEVRTVEAVSEGQELTYSYIDMYMTKKQRAERLKTVYYINNCYCVRCKESGSASLDRFLGGFACSKCEDGVMLAKDEKEDKTVHCQSGSCDGERGKEEAEAMEREARVLLERGVALLSRGEVDESRRYLEAKLMKGDAGKALHRHHVIRFNAALALVAVTREQLDWSAQAEYCKMVVDSLEMLKLSNHPECADAFFAMGEALIGCAADADGESEAAKDAKEELLLRARDAFARALAIRTICYGAKHPVTKEAQVRVTDLTPKGEKKKAKK